MTGTTRTQDYQFNISNPSPADKEFNLLGAAYNGTNISNPGGAGPFINVPQSSTAQVQRDNQVSSFIIRSMKISVSNEAQLTAPFEIVTQDMSGARTVIPFSLQRFTNPMYGNQKLIIIDKSTGFNGLKVWSDVGFHGTIKAGTNMDIYIVFEYIYRPGMSNYTSAPPISIQAPIEQIIEHLYKHGSRVAA